MRLCVLTIALLGVASAATAQEDIVIGDFEGPTYGLWRATGSAFGVRPARGTLPRQMRVSGYQGQQLANSFYNGDRSVGTLTSPTFKIERRYVNFLIGGGQFPGRTCVNLLVGRRIVRTATGQNLRPGGSELMRWQTWDVEDFADEEATIQIVDQRSGYWGHVTVDHIVQSDRSAQGEKALEMVFAKKYLNLPVKNDALKRRMKIIIEGKVVREFEIELAESDPDFFVFLDITAFAGKKAHIEVSDLPPRARALQLITQDDVIRGAENLYQEKHRPQFHFSSRRGWNNDSNGLVFYRGEYHLYYQHNPYGWKWGNMHWGHAVSTDLVHWKELPIAIYPQEFGDWVFSGGGLVDWDNTAGFKTGPEDVIIAAYTSTGRGECIAYSLDRGRTFTDYEGNPVVKHKGRDPKIIWYAPGEHWSMAVYHEIEKRRTIAFYTSRDLKNWEYQSCIDGFYECPEIFELAVDGEENNTRWVLHAADGNYMLGAFDGKTFTPESEKHQGNYGNCFYASQTYSDIPVSDGRRIQVAWGRIATPGMPFNQCMLFPCVLTLRRTEDGIRMFAEPVKEIETLHKTGHAWQNVTLPAGKDALAALSGDLFHIQATFDVGQAEQVGFVIRGVDVVYDVAKKELSCQGKSAPLKAAQGQLQLEILVDRTSIEIFGNRGEVYMPIGVIPADENRSLEVFGKGPAARLVSMEVHELDSAWDSDQ